MTADNLHSYQRYVSDMRRFVIVNKPRIGLDTCWLHRGRNINTLIANPWSRPRDRLAQITRSRGVVQWLPGGVPAQIGAGI